MQVLLRLVRVVVAAPEAGVLTPASLAAALSAVSLAAVPSVEERQAP